MSVSLSGRLKLTHLKLISAIQDCGQLGLAAESLSITQPTASRMLAELEDIVGAKLFERKAKGLQPTGIGFAMTSRAKTILLELRDLQREVEELKEGKAGTVSVGAVTGAAVGFVIPAVQDLRKHAPRAEVHIDVEPADTLSQSLLDGKNDFVLARIAENINVHLFDITPAATEEVKFVVGITHPLTTMKNISLADLSPYEWVIQSSRSPIREAIGRVILEADIPRPATITNTTSLLAIIAILTSSQAIAPVTTEVANLLTGQHVGAKLKVLSVKESIVLPAYYLLEIKGRRLSPLAARLKALILKRIDNLKG